jgi:ribosomal-protein-alanine N-acetyltransferase
MLLFRHWSKRMTPHKAPHSGFNDIQTPRLDLVPVTPRSLQIQAAASATMRAKLGALLHARVPQEWPHENWEPHVYEYLLNLIAEHPEAVGWCRYLILRDDHGVRTVIGTFGSGFPRPETSEAEIGYGLLRAYQRQGFAAEAVIAMLPWLQTQRKIRAFVAQTFPHLRGSIRVLEKTGFQPAGFGYEEGTVLFRRECLNPSS